jgi:hypothetical protein
VELLGPAALIEERADLLVDAERRVLGVAHVAEEDVDRRPAEVVGDEVAAVQRHALQLRLDARHLLGRRRDAEQQRRRREHVLGRVDDVGDAEDLRHALDLRELVRDVGDLLDRRRREDVVGQDPDHADVVAAEEPPDLVVVGDLRVVRGQHALERALDADLQRVDAERDRDQEVRDHDRERASNEPARESLHGGAHLARDGPLKHALPSRHFPGARSYAVTWRTGPCCGAGASARA